MGARFGTEVGSWATLPISTEPFMSTASAASATHFLPTPPLVPPARRRAPHKGSTVTAYAKALRHFTEVFRGVIPCSEATVLDYVASMRKNAAATIYLRVQGVRAAHVQAGHPNPIASPGMRALMRDLQQGVVPGKAGAAKRRKEPRQAKAIDRALLEKMLAGFGANTALERRDRCLLLLGFAAALSRSALVNLDATSIRFTPDVMVLRVRESDDPTEAPRIITVNITGGPLCAATATLAWIKSAALDIEGGPLLRRFDRASNPTPGRLGAPFVNCVIKQRLRAVGVDPNPYAALSLRRGRVLEIAGGKL